MRSFLSKNYIRTIGITGSSGCVGVTHLSIMLANYLASKERSKTAVLELNSSGAFERLKERYAPDNEQTYFKYQDVEYFCRPSQRMIANTFGMGYQYLVMDFGKEWRNTSYEWSMCNVKIVIGDCCEWKQEEFDSMVSDMREWIEPGNCIFMAQKGNRTVRKRMERRHRIRLLNIPFEENPFQLHKDSLSFFKQLT